MLFQSIQKLGSKAEISFHEIFRILRTVYSGKVKHEICLRTVFIQFLVRAVQIILINFIYGNIRPGSVFSISNIFQIIAKGGSHHTLCSGH